MPQIEENRYLGKKLTRYPTFKKDPKSGLYQYRKYNPKIKFDPFRIRNYNKSKNYDQVKFENKPLGDVLTKDTRDYVTKPYDNFYEYNPAQDEKEEKVKKIVRVHKKKEKQEIEEKKETETFFPDGLWKGTINTVQRNFLLLYRERSKSSPMLQSPPESRQSSPMQSQPITPAAISPLQVTEIQKEPEVEQETPKAKPKKVVIQETPTEVKEIVAPEPPTTLIPGYINIDYSSKRWNDF